MGFCKTHAITLKRRDYSNSSQIATLYTRSRGKIRALAKGSKRIEKKLRGSVDLFSHMEVILLQKGGTGLNLLTEWEPIHDFPAFRKDVERFYAACHVAELADLLTEEGDRSEPLFDLILDTFASLSSTKRTEVALRAFELQTLKLIGCLPELEVCANCGGNLTESTAAVFSPVDSGLLCERCNGQKTYRTLSPGTIRAAVFLANASTATWDRLRLPNGISEELVSLSRGCITGVLSRPLETRRFAI
ncbi:MAG: DNA repair protein RecO [Planctomycetes bacterium]|nr:DNA repair protein RecO [Planctomycetota bacterium]